MTVLADRKSVSLGLKARRIFAELKAGQGQKPEFKVGASFNFKF
ncbi:MAG: hypothetical protein AB1403_00640 [Candidatus Riflebacteria bacterium]